MKLSELTKMKVNTHKYTFKHRGLETDYNTSENLNDFVFNSNSVTYETNGKNSKCIS